MTIATTTARADDARASALDDRLSRLLAIGGGELPRARAVTPDVADEGGGEDAAARETMGSETAATTRRARAYRRPRGWRDILRATRERVRRGRAAMGEPLGEEDETGTWSAAVNARLRDPRPDGLRAGDGAGRGGRAAGGTRADRSSRAVLGD